MKIINIKLLYTNKLYIYINDSIAFRFIELFMIKKRKYEYILIIK